ncbi:TPA: plasmid recombination protein [Klebsiella pneumoniae]|nr:plasmid recombination protein [Klebsiella pneumoniae]
MAYAILRVEKTKTGAIAGKNSHNMRTRETPNADPSRLELNRVLVGSGNLRNDIKQRFAETDVKARNSTSVICNELILTASKEFFTNDNLESWINTQMDYLKSEFGENCVNAVFHGDEQTPHIHAFITPIQKLDNGKFKLNNKGYMKDYATMQNIYYEHNSKLGLERGISKDLTQADYKSVKEFYSDIVNTEKDSKLEIEQNSVKTRIVSETETKRSFFVEREVPTHFTGAEVNSSIRKAVEPFRKQNRELTKRVNGFKRQYHNYKQKHKALSESSEKETRRQAIEMATKLTDERTARLSAEITSLKGSVSHFKTLATNIALERDQATADRQRLEFENAKLESYRNDAKLVEAFKHYKPQEFNKLVDGVIEAYNLENAQKQQQNGQNSDFKPKTPKPL